jgi:hypothetical protein
MNAPANIRLAKRRDEYRPTVERMLPGVEGEELQLRCSLLLMRDSASATLRHCSEDAAGVLQQVESLAAVYAFTPLPLDELRELRRTLVRLTSCASGLEAFAFNLEHKRGPRGRG